MDPNDLTPANQTLLWLQPLLVTVMIICLAMSVISAAESLIPGWAGQRVLIGIAITALEAIYSFRVLRLPRSRGTSMLRYRLAEAFCLGVLMKVVSYFGRDWSEIMPELIAMWGEPGAFFSNDYLILLASAWLTWSIVNRIMADFEALDDPFLSQNEQQAPRDKLTSRFYWGGGLLVLFIGIRYFAADPSLPRVRDYHLNALLYFLLGTVILSQMHLTTLLTGWRLQNISVADRMVKSWIQYGLVFLVIMILVVAVLPTSYSMGLYDTVLLGLKMLVDLMRRLMELLIMIVMLPLSWLLGLFGHGEGGVLPPAPTVDTVAPPPAPRAPTTFPWKVIRGIVFWLTFFGVAIYLIRSYLEDHPELVEMLKRLTQIHQLLGAFAALLAFLVKWIDKGLNWRPKLVRTQTEAETPRASRARKRWRWGRSLGNSDRERVIRAYLQMLEYAAAAGIQRHQHQTPYEYAPTLHRVLPDEANDVDGLTDGFMESRYGPGQVESEEAAKVVAHSERVQQALRQLRDREEGGSK